MPVARARSASVMGFAFASRATSTAMARLTASTPGRAALLAERSAMVSPDQSAHDRPVVLAEAGLDGGVEEAFDPSGAVEADARLLAEQQRVAQILPRVTHRERLQRVVLWQDRLHPVVAQRKGVGGAMGERIEEDLGVHSHALADRLGLAERQDVFEE